jgi:hypothetical protein
MVMRGASLMEYQAALAAVVAVRAILQNPHKKQSSHLQNRRLQRKSPLRVRKKNLILIQKTLITILLSEKGEDALERF